MTHYTTTRRAASAVSTLALAACLWGTALPSIAQDMTVSAGTERIDNGEDRAVNGTVYVARQAGETATLEIDGEGTSLTATGDLSVAENGTGFMRITNGADVTNVRGAVGNIPSRHPLLSVFWPSTGIARVEVDGAGSTWTNSGQLTVGVYSKGELHISGSGAVTSESLLVGRHGVPETGVPVADWMFGEGRVTVTGAGSTLTTRSILAGDSGGDGYITVSDGGRLSTERLLLGSGGTGVNGMMRTSQGHVVVTGAGSRLDVTDELSIGLDSFGTVTLADGGTVSAKDVGLAVKPYPLGRGGEGWLIIGGGLDQDGNPLAARGAGTLTAQSLLFGDGEATLLFNHTDSDYSFAVPMSGTGRILHAAGTTTLTGDSSGFSGLLEASGGTLTLSAPAGAEDVFVARNTGETATLVVAGEAATLTASGNLSVGYEGTGLLRVTGGAAVASRSGAIGNQPSLNDVVQVYELTQGTGRAEITGTGSTWTNSRELTIGAKSDGELIISDGGVVRNSFATVGFFADRLRDGDPLTWDLSTGRVSVTGIGSQWINAGNLSVGSAGGDGAVAITGGGRVSVDGQVRVASGGAGEELNGISYNRGSLGLISISGIGSELSATGALHLAPDGTGSVIVADGGRLSVQTIELGGVSHIEGEGLLAIGGGQDAAGQLMAAAGAGEVQAGALHFGDGDATLLFNHTDSNYSFAVPVSGAGRIWHAAGTTTLTGDSSGFTGETQVSGGALIVNGSLGGATEVLSGGTLRGSGTLGDLTVAGALMPGGAPGTLTVTGDLVMREGSTLHADVASGSADRIAVSGAAVIEGGTVVVTALDPETSYSDGTVFNLITAGGGVTGSFDSLEETSAFLDFHLAITPGAVTLTVDVLRQFPDVALTFNQAEASRGLAELDEGGADGLAVYNHILMMDEAEARAAFDASSGEIYAVLQGAGLRQAQALDRSLTPPRTTRGWTVWGGATAARSRVTGDGNGHGYDHDADAVEAGVAYGDGQWSAAAAAGLTRSDTALGSRQSAQGDGWYAGLAARWGGVEGFSATAAAVHAVNRADVRRVITYTATPRVAAARVDVTATAAHLDLAWGWALNPGWTAGPVASAEHVRVDLGRIAESGAGSLNLSGGGEAAGWTRYGLGGFVQWQGERGAFEARVQHVTGGDGDGAASLALEGAPGTPFAVRASAPGDDALRLSFSGRYELAPSWSVEGFATALTAKNDRTVTLGGRVKFSF